MYTQIFLVTSVRGRVLAPQIFAIASLSFFGAKMPFPAFFGKRILLGRRRLSLLASRLLLGRDLLQSRLRDRRLRRRHRRLRGSRHRDRGKKVQTR